MNLKKSQWSAENDNLSLNVPFAKVDEERRIVSGFATLDNIDQQGDRITAEANTRAFSNSRRNLREMHANIAAGRVLDFKEESFYDAKTNKNYVGVFVEAYISKGAPLTWEKVLDGTLTGFSIGGKVKESEPHFDKASSKNIRIIKDYDLIELSLVDSPANQLANIFSVQKVDGTLVAKGMAAETKVENVYYCATDELAKSSSDEAATCSVCSNEMQNIGWFESSDDSMTQTQEMVNKFLNSEESKGGVKMNNTENELENVSEEEEVSKSEEVEETPSEEATVTEEVNTDEPNLEKMLDELKESVQDSVNNATTKADEAVTTIKQEIEDFKKSYDEKFAELETKFDDFNKSLDSSKSEVTKVEKRLEVMEGASAIRKSAEVETADDETSDDGRIFKGAFLPLSGVR